MARYTGGDDIATGMCELLGFPNEGIKELVIDWSPGSVVYARVSVLLTKDQIAAMGRLMQAAEDTA